MKEVKIKGLNINRFLTLLMENKITPKKIERPLYDEIIIEISNKDYKNLVALKQASCYNISVVNEIPTFPLLIMSLKRIGLLAGLLVAIYILLSMTTKIWSINISVSEENPEVETMIQEVLAQKGVKIGNPLTMNTRELERELTALIDESASVVVTKSGINLDVFVKLRVYKPEITKTDIVSAYDGKITDIKLTSGILTVNKGEGVSKGQVLIASGAVGDFYAEAVGEITAKVLISGEAIGSTETEVVNRTGEFEEVYAYKIFGKIINFKESVEEVGSKFLGYEVEEVETLMFKNNCLPIKKVTYRVYELVTSKVTKPEDEIIKDLKEKAYVTAKNNLPSGAVEGAVSYDVFNANGILKVVCNIETEIQIGVRNNEIKENQ